jgi:hypothetical protein
MLAGMTIMLIQLLHMEQAVHSWPSFLSFNQATRTHHVRFLRVISSHRF